MPRPMDTSDRLAIWPCSPRLIAARQILGRRRWPQSRNKLPEDDRYNSDCGRRILPALLVRPLAPGKKRLAPSVASLATFARHGSFQTSGKYHPDVWKTDAY
jgi:hypothetical protein